ncbi:hypothetical protein [Pseudoxanthomonas sp. LjRoot143]|uniref:hypothetical protein n=1 Tax=Pseudoxanthomonas sp. LjRoot143 TaxID=3342266 RepID=UPI003F4FB943
MKEIFCPACQKQTPTRPWDFAPGLKLARDLYWCRTCHEWFAFSDRSRRIALGATVASIFLGVFALRISLDFSDDQRMTGWPAFACLMLILVFANVASAVALRSTAELVGPIDHAP